MGVISHVYLYNLWYIIDTRACMISPGWLYSTGIVKHHFWEKYRLFALLLLKMTADSLVSVLPWTLPNILFPIACHNPYLFTVMNWNHDYDISTDFYETIIYAPEDYYPQPYGNYEFGVKFRKIHQWNRIHYVLQYGSHQLHVVV